MSAADARTIERREWRLAALACAGLLSLACAVAEPAKPPPERAPPEPIAPASRNETPDPVAPPEAEAPAPVVDAAPEPESEPAPVAATPDPEPPISHPEAGPEAPAAPVEDRAGKPDEVPREETAEEAKEDNENEDLITLAPGLRVNRRERRVEADAEVCLTQGSLELLVTTPEGKPHEAIFTLKPKPRQLHAALLILGLSTGTPGHYGAFGATGDRVRIDVAFDNDGEEVVIPINELVSNNETGDHLPANVFVFAGSLLARAREGNRLIYAADVAGDVVSLVSFADEVLALSDPASSENGQLMWSVDGGRLPDVGTSVVLRIAPCAEAEDTPDAESETERE
jgi:hypothetical protein